MVECMSRPQNRATYQKRPILTFAVEHGDTEMGLSTRIMKSLSQKFQIPDITTAINTRIEDKLYLNGIVSTIRSDRTYDPGADSTCITIPTLPRNSNYALVLITFVHLRGLRPWDQLSDTRDVGVYSLPYDDEETAAEAAIVEKVGTRAGEATKHVPGIQGGRRRLSTAT